MTDALRGGVVSLIRDLNGNHVIQRCLQRLGPEDSQFVYDAAAAHTLEIATHRHGCCVLQRCIDFATAPQKRRLVETIAAHALPLSQVGMLVLLFFSVLLPSHCSRDLERRNCYWRYVLPPSRPLLERAGTCTSGLSQMGRAGLGMAGARGPAWGGVL